jgi:hypothetical protein
MTDIARPLSSTFRASALPAHRAPPLMGLLLFVVLFQRFALPVGEGISVTILAFPFGVVLLWRDRHLVADRGRTFLYLLAIAACLLGVAIGQGRGHSFSPMSLALLVALYAPFCQVVQPSERIHYRAMIPTFTGLMSILAVVAIAQMAIQLAGVHYDDPFRNVPSNFLVQGYNTLAPVRYGSPIYRSNAVVFLEPSFLSQYLALSFVIGLVHGASSRKLLLDSVGILTTVSGTGIVLIGLAAVLLALWQANIWLFRILVPAVVLLLALQATPASNVFSQRVNERNTEDSSFAQRFTAPYHRAADFLEDDDMTFLFGLGPGAAERDAKAVLKETGRPISYSPLTKLPIEYGLIGFLAFGSFTLYLFFAGSPSLVVAFAVAVFYFLLSGNLLQPPTVALCWILTSLFAGPKTGALE